MQPPTDRLDPDAAVPARLIFFTASGSAPCREAAAEVKKLADRGYLIETVDADQAPELMKRYNVTAVPTFVLVAPSGAELGRVSGSVSAARLARLYTDAIVRSVGPLPPPGAADPDRRIADLERKLDEVLKALAALKQGAASGPLNSDPAPGGPGRQ